MRVRERREREKREERREKREERRERENDIVHTPIKSVTRESNLLKYQICQTCFQFLTF